MSKPIIERKFVPVQNLQLEKRADESSSELPDIVGYSALFDSETIIESWWGDGWREVIRKGFFAPAIKDNHDVRALFNHDANFVLGRSTSPKKTLQLKEDKTGLFSRISPPNNSIGRDVVESIERGDISGQSFAFTLASEKWTKGNRKKGELDLRELLAIDTLYDVGPVTYPAFADTDISVDRAAAMAQLDMRSRALRSWGEEVPQSALREFTRGSQIQVPSTFDISGVSREELRTIVREELREALAEENDEVKKEGDESSGEGESKPVETPPTEQPPEPKEEAPAEEPAPEAEAEAQRLDAIRAERRRLELVELGA